MAPGFRLSRFAPAERGSRYFTAESLDWRSGGVPSTGVLFDYAHKPLVLYRFDESGQEEVVSVVRNFVTMHLGSSVSLGDRFRVGFDLPVLLYGDGTTAQLGLVGYAGPQRSALGDLRLSGDVRFFGQATSPVRLGLGLQLTLPTGEARAYMGDGLVSGAVQVNAAGEAFGNQFAWAGRVGTQLRGTSMDFAGASIGSQLTFGGVAGYRTVDGRFFAGPEFSAATAFRDFMGGPSTSVELGISARYAFSESWRVGASVGRGLTVTPGSPAVRGLLALEWTPAPVPAPKCEGPTAEELEAARRTARAEGVQQARDDAQAADAAQRAREAQAAAALADAERLAADEASARRAADDDADGLANAADRCAAEAGPSRANDAITGCPVGAIVGDLIVIDPIRFAHDSDVILPESDAILSKVVEALRRIPAQTRVRIEGHTDDRGHPAYNKHLSERRAKSVQAWLSARGLEAARFDPQGYGAAQPLVANDSDEHRLHNRRVEFHLLTGEAK